MNNANDNLLKQLSKQNNINVDELKKAAQQGNIDSYISKKLPKDASQKIQQVLSDKAATEKLLSTPEAKELMKKLMNK